MNISNDKAGVIKPGMWKIFFIDERVWLIYN